MRSPTRGAWTALATLLLVVATGCSIVSPPASAAGEPAWPPTPPPAVTSTTTPTPTATHVARRVPVVVLDPGHAVDESGAAAHGVVEKESNLDMAVRIATLLRARGVEAILTREADVRATPPGDQPTRAQGFSGTRNDLQARIDLANAAKADVFVSLHSNGAGDPSIRGYEVYYNAQRPFAAANHALARALLDGVTAAMGAEGYPATARGVIDDTCLKAFQGRCFPLFVLGPPRVTDRDEVYRRGGTPEALGFAPGQQSITTRATEMPGALVELLFISSPEDAALLRDEGARNAMARGVAFGILDHLASKGR